MAEDKRRFRLRHPRRPLFTPVLGCNHEKGGTVYLHVLSAAEKAVAVPDFGKKIKGASLLNGTKVEFASTGLGTIVRLPETGRDPFDTIVALAVQ